MKRRGKRALVRSDGFRLFSLSNIEVDGGLKMEKKQSAKENQNDAEINKQQRQQACLYLTHTQKEYILHDINTVDKNTTKTTAILMYTMLKH